MVPHIKIEDYNYDLPQERIAKYPLSQRDASKLLRYRDGLIDEFVFRDIPGLLPEHSMLIYNDTKVVPARLHFKRASGAVIEIFCLQPVDPAEYNQVFSCRESCVWKCVVGNVKRWKGDILDVINPEDNAEVRELQLRSELLERQEEVSIVRLSWKGGAEFSHVLEVCGKIPIPPYLNRDTESIDIERYQTTYARLRGSVAAPTAGLHFTPQVLEEIRLKGIEERTVCLHVGAGTFLPVKSAEIAGHPMHKEYFVVSASLIRTLVETDKPVIAVGTTSIRTLESLYYAGVDCIEKGEPSEVQQWAPYIRDYKYSTKESLQAILSYLERSGQEELRLGTRIIIVPGFDFRIVSYLITNFHQPQSTLLLLISAFVGGDWKTIYDYAMSHDFRFLSYGDSSLLYRAKQ